MIRINENKSKEQTKSISPLRFQGGLGFVSNDVNHCPNDVHHYPNDVNHCPNDVNHCPNDVHHCPNDVHHCINDVNHCNHCSVVIKKGYLSLVCLLLLLFHMSLGNGLFAQDAEKKREVSGVVVDGLNGDPVVGASVLVKGTKKGMKADFEGNFKLALEEGEVTLIVTAVGYEKKEVVVGDQASVKVMMDTKQISDIVVVGYGVQEKRDVTGSVASVNAKDIARTVTNDPLKALQGRVAGVTITQSSGRLDAKPEVIIRGPGTLNNNTPLYVVDGIVLSDESVKLSFIVNEDIESIDVLKDASASAIYGARGANGVILITTKKGKEGKVNVSISAYGGVQVVPNRIKMVTSQQYAEMYNEYLTYQNNNKPTTYYNPSTVKDYNFFNDVLRVAAIQNYSLSVTGGSKDVTYALSGNAWIQDGFLIGDNFARYSVRANNEYKLLNRQDPLLSRVVLGHDISFAYSSETESPGDAIASAYRFEPVKPLKDENGVYNTSIINVGNPLLTIDKQYNKRERNQLLANVFLTADFLDGFNAKVSYGLSFYKENFKRFTPTYNYGALAMNALADLEVFNASTVQWSFDALLNYNKKIDVHSINAVLGYSMQEYNNETLRGAREGFPGNEPIYWFLDAGNVPASQTNNNTADSWAMMSFFARGSYSLMDRYLVTLTFRADGSSRFGPNNRFGFFPAVGLGWRITEEDFMKELGLDWLSNLKLRTSWGQTGNDRIGNYSAYTTIVADDGTRVFFGREPQQVQAGATQANISNPVIRWEVVTQWDVGFEWGLFDDMLTGEIDYYNKKTDGILINVPLPDLVGAGNDPTVNAAEVLNQGLEAIVTFRQRAGDVYYSISANTAYNANNVLKLGTGRSEIIKGGISGSGSKNATKTVAGQPMSMFYGYIAEGVFQTEEQLASLPKFGSPRLGDLRYKDLNGDGVIDEKDKTFIGKPWPDVTLNLSFTLEYAGFDFAMNWTGVFGVDIYNGKKSNRTSFYNVEASEATRWSPTNTSSNTLRANADAQEVSTYFLEDGSYFKLQSISLGYTVPSVLTKNVGISRLRFYLQGTNVWTFTKYTGFTPELGNPGDPLSRNIDNSVFPVASIYSAGVQINF